MNLPRMLIFNERSVYTLEIKLQRVYDLKWISWEFTHEDTLILIGFNQPITFTHWKAAHAFLDGYLAGYADCEENSNLDDDDMDQWYSRAE